MNETLFSRRLWAFFVLLVICFYSLSVQGKYGGGTGEPNDPYLIYDADQMNAIGADANDWDKHFMLMANIDMSAYTYTTALIATDTDNTNNSFEGIPFTGVFNGVGQTISNLTINTLGVDNDYLGLFGEISEQGQVKSLGLENISIIGGTESRRLGGLCGSNYGTITNCYVTGSIAGDRGLGGLCGINTGTISDCYSECLVSEVYKAFSYGQSPIGGLCGVNYGAISNCYATGAISGNRTVGGLCGWNFNIISNCYATGPVSGGIDSEYLGGLCGQNQYSIINHCYSTGSVTGADGSSNLGGLCGSNTGGIGNCYATGLVTGGIDSEYLGGLCGVSTAILYHSFWDTQTSGLISSAGGVGKTTAEMMDINTYAGWGDNIWTIDDGNDYPHLIWENQPGVPITNPIRTYSGGSGDPNDPYLIAEPNDLITLGIYSDDWDKHYKLANDIDLSAFVFNTRLIPEFRGVFDGAGYSISYLTIDTLGADSDYLGLFGNVIGEQAQVKNLELENVSFTGGSDSWNVGGLSGRNTGIISNCYVIGAVDGYRQVGGLCGISYGTISDCHSECLVSGGENVGSLCGYNGGTISSCDATGSVTGGVDSKTLGGLCGYNSGTISKCYSEGLVSGHYSVGGLCGYNWGTISNCYAIGSATGDGSLGGLIGTNNRTIRDCYSTGNVTGADSSARIGGLCGHNGSNGTINNCYSTGSVGGTGSYLGGLCGWNNQGTISNCYSTGSVTGVGQLGGLCGENGGGTISNCYWDIETSGQTTSAGGTGLTTTEMQMLSTFIVAGWDFVGETINGPNDIWRLCEDLVSYPRLTWEFPLGDFLCPEGVDFIDYSFFALHWLEGNCDASNDCEGTDLDQSGAIGSNDLGILADNWLEGVRQPIPPSPGCIAHWKFDDGSGNTATDSAGKNNGALIGNPTWTTGRVDGALSFDGSAEYVVAAPVVPLAGDNFTALAWIRIDESAGQYNSFLMQNRYSDNYGFYFYISNDKPDVYVFGSSGNSNANSTETLNSNQWYHVATTNDGSNLKLYVDGQLKDTDSSAGLTGVNENAYIGFDPISSIYYMGLIDDVRIYDRALTEEEIAYLAD